MYGLRKLYAKEMALTYGLTLTWTFALLTFTTFTVCVGPGKGGHDKVPWDGNRPLPLQRAVCERPTCGWIKEQIETEGGDASAYSKSEIVQQVDDSLM
jgi:hypothetical protein